MSFFDFHHHDSGKNFGIYNLKFTEIPPENYFSAGIHPDAVSDGLDEKLHWLREISAHENCVAIGECGLDGLIDVDEELQRKAFFCPNRDRQFGGETFNHSLCQKIFTTSSVSQTCCSSNDCPRF